MTRRENCSFELLTASLTCHWNTVQNCSVAGKQCIGPSATQLHTGKSQIMSSSLVLKFGLRVYGRPINKRRDFDPDKVLANHRGGQEDFIFFEVWQGKRPSAS